MQLSTLERQLWLSNNPFQLDSAFVLVAAEVLYAFFNADLILSMCDVIQHDIQVLCAILRGPTVWFLLRFYREWTDHLLFSKWTLDSAVKQQEHRYAAAA